MAPSSDLAAALADHATPLDTTDPTADLADLRPLADVFEGVEVVGLGEATHGTREFFRLKHRLVRFLVEELGFRLFGLEANFAETLAIDDYVVRGEGDPEDALEGIYFWTWDTEEVLAMIEWMRSFNEGRPEGDRIRFYGFDAQYTAGAARALREYLETAAPETLDEWGDTLSMLADEGLDDEDAFEERRQEAEELVAALQDWFDRRAGDAETPAGVSHDLAARHLRTLEQAVELWRARHADEREAGVRFRDRAMAENVSWILDHERHDRVALWAHNTHLKRVPRSNDWGEADAMGVHLGREYGDGYYALGFTFERGSFQAMVEDGDDLELRECSLADPPADSVAGLLADADAPLAFLDLNPATADDPVADWLARETWLRFLGAIHEPDGDVEAHHDRIVPSEAFDGLLYVEETTRAVPVDRPDEE